MQGWHLVWNCFLPEMSYEEYWTVLENGQLRGRTAAFQEKAKIKKETDGLQQ